MTRRCVFLDRDGVINVKPNEGEYVRGWNEFHLIPNTIDWIRLFNALDFLVIVVTNQRGIARDLMTRADVDEIHDRMLRELAAQDAVIDDVFVCPHEVGVCDCRKPLPGMIHAAGDKWDIEISRSIMIGDSESDEQLAKNCGMTFVGAGDGVITHVHRSLSEQPGDQRVRG